jgi:hypothetical protein
LSAVLRHSTASPFWQNQRKLSALINKIGSKRMRKVMIMLVAAAALLFAGALAWKAEAASWGGAANLVATAKNFTPIIKTACGGPGANCRAGRHWVCGPAGRCWCAPC